MKVADISEQGRATQGVKLIRLDEGDEIAAITRLEDHEGENGNGNQPAPEGGEPGGNNDENATGNPEVSSGENPA
jgi:DNA gyrase subunit A